MQSTAGKEGWRKLHQFIFVVEKKLQKGNTQQNNSTQFDMQDICKITRYFLEPLYDLNKNDMQFF